MGAEQKTRELGISFPVKEKGYLNQCVRSGKLLMTSGHISDTLPPALLAVGWNGPLCASVRSPSACRTGAAKRIRDNPRGLGTSWGSRISVFPFGPALAA